VPRAHHHHIVLFGKSHPSTLFYGLHPDRFQSDQKLKDAAETKLKDINSAYEFLTSTADERGPWRPPSRPASDAASAPSREPPANGETASTSPPGRGTGSSMPDLTPFSGCWPWPIIRFSKLAARSFALLLGRYLWIAFEVPDPTGGDVARVYDQGKESILRGLDGPKRRFFDASRARLAENGPANSTAAPPDIQQTGRPTVGQPATRAGHAQKASGQLPDRSSTAPPKILPYITVGSTRDEVLAQQGTPTASSEDKLVYGKSELYLKGGSVIGWRIDPVSSPIRVKLWPSTAVDPSLAVYSSWLHERYGAHRTGNANGIHRGQVRVRQV
jgi:hypothetical protein